MATKKIASVVTTSHTVAKLDVRGSIRRLRIARMRMNSSAGVAATRIRPGNGAPFSLSGRRRRVAMCVSFATFRITIGSTSKGSGSGRSGWKEAMIAAARNFVMRVVPVWAGIDASFAARWRLSSCPRMDAVATVEAMELAFRRAQFISLLSCERLFCVGFVRFILCAHIVHSFFIRQPGTRSVGHAAPPSTK